MYAHEEQRFDHHAVDQAELHRIAALAAKEFFPNEHHHNLKRLLGGFSNGNFSIANELGHFVIRVYSAGMAAALREKVLLNTILPEYMIATPKWLDFCLIEEVVAVALVEFCEGQVLSLSVREKEVSRDTLYNLGQTLGRIHSIKFECTGLFNQYGVVKAGQWDFLEPWPKFIRSALNGRAGKRLGANKLAHLKEIVEESWPKIVAVMKGPRFVHGDFNTKNILTVGDRPIVLDWEFAHSGHWLTDLGNLFRFDEWSAEQTMQILSGYESVIGPLPVDWRKLSMVLDLFNMVEFLDRNRDLPKTFQTALDVITNTLQQFKRE